METPQKDKLTRRTAVRKLLMALNRKQRMGKFTRISPEIYDEVENAAQARCHQIMDRQERVGKTIR